MAFVMRGFVAKEIRAAIGFSLAGNMALHLHTLGVGKAAPAVFRTAVASGYWIAHLFDQNAERLVRVACELGVSQVVIDRRGEAAQHVDLCGNPLARAFALCDNAADLPDRPAAALVITDEFRREPDGKQYAPARQHHDDKPARVPPSEVRFGNLPPLGRMGGLFGGTLEE